MNNTMEHDLTQLALAVQRADRLTAFYYIGKMSAALEAAGKEYDKPGVLREMSAMLDEREAAKKHPLPVTHIIVVKAARTI